MLPDYSGTLFDPPAEQGCGCSGGGCGGDCGCGGSCGGCNGGCTGGCSGGAGSSAPFSEPAFEPANSHIPIDFLGAWSSGGLGSSGPQLLGSAARQVDIPNPGEGERGQITKEEPEPRICPKECEDLFPRVEKACTPDCFVRECMTIAHIYAECIRSAGVDPKMCPQVDCGDDEECHELPECKPLYRAYLASQEDLLQPGGFARLAARHPKGYGSPWSKYKECCLKNCKNVKGKKGRSKKSARSCRYGGANITCNFSIPGPTESPIPTFCECTWKLDCVCCKTSDSEGMKCVRGCVQCLKSVGADVDAHNDCFESCREDGKWTDQDEQEFRRVADDCLVCNDPYCESAMRAGIPFRTWEIMKRMGNCVYRETGSGPIFEAAEGCSDEDRNG